MSDEVGCAPDCDERSECEQVGTLGHAQCGRCSECGGPRHHGCTTMCRRAAEVESGVTAQGRGDRG